MRRAAAFLAGTALVGCSMRVTLGVLPLASGDPDGGVDSSDVDTGFVEPDAGDIDDAGVWLSDPTDAALDAVQIEPPADAALDVDH